MQALPNLLRTPAGLLGLAGLAVLLVPGLAGCSEANSSPVSMPPAVEGHKRVIVLGIDGMDPELLEEAIQRYPDRMPNFARLVAEGGVHSLGTSVPPQSPVAWSNFITGMNPGGHGIYDFIHRDPVTRGPLPGSVKAVAGDHVSLWGDWQFPIGGESETNRTGESFWVTLAKNGVPADIWRMPANFPVEPAEGLSFPGMMTPALDSAYGTYTIYSTDPPVEKKKSGGQYIEVTERRDGKISTYIEGPPNAFKVGDPHQRATLTFYPDRESGAVAIDTGTDVIVLEPGEWSDFTTLEFELLPASLMNMTGIVRFYLRSLEPEFELYASPVNIDPMNPVMPVAEPVTASGEIVDAIGYYYTQGMAEEVNALKDGALDDREFMAQTKLVYDQRVRMMDYALDRYLEKDGGLFFFYYSTVDLNSHMMWRFHDDQHPQHPLIAEMAAQDSSEWSGREGSTWKEVVYDLYLLMDPVLGHLRERVGDDVELMVMSDHGFAPYNKKFSLNRWLVEEGYMVLKEGRTPELPRNDPAYSQVFIMDAVDWSKTKAYGMGFNGLYLNLAGREHDSPATPEDESGIVQPGSEADTLLAELKRKLEALRDEGEPIVLVADLAKDVYQGTRTAEAPDIQVGFNAGYGNSDASSTGRIPHDILTENMGGTFNGNHLMAPEVVPGILLTNGQVRPGAHALEDLTIEILGQYGLQPGEGQNGHRVLE